MKFSSFLKEELSSQLTNDIKSIFNKYIPKGFIDVKVTPSSKWGSNSYTIKFGFVDDVKYRDEDPTNSTIYIIPNKNGYELSTSATYGVSYKLKAGDSPTSLETIVKIPVKKVVGDADAMKKTFELVIKKYKKEIIDHKEKIRDYDKFKKYF